jgi:hypothetical protein
MGDRRPPVRNFKKGEERTKLTRNLQQLQAALQQRITNAASCKLACEKLCESAFHKPDVQMMIGRLGLLEDVQEAMQRHEKSAELQEAACRTVAAVGGHQANCNKAAELLPEIISAMGAHVGSPSVPEAACRAVSAIALNPKSREACCSLKVLSAIQKCMRAHRGNPGLQEAAFSAVSNVVLETPSTQAQAVRLGLVDDIDVGMKAHATVTKVVERGQVAIERCTAVATTAGTAATETAEVEDGGDDADDLDEEEEECSEEEDDDA